MAVKKKTIPPKAGATRIINKLITSRDQQEWVLKEISNEGPAHKQVLSTLLLQRLGELVKVLEKDSGSAFQLQPGYRIVSETHKGEGKTMPLDFPVKAATKADERKIIKAVSAAPLHELLAYTISLQVIEWAILAKS